MKKILLLFTVGAFIFNTNAQTQQTKGSEEISVGIKGGVNLASITGDDTSDLDGLTGFNAGVVVNIPVSDIFSVQPEVLYSAQGAKYTMSEGYDGKYKLNYINVPVMAEIQIASGLNVEAGPQIGFLASAKEEYSSTGDSGEDDIKDYIKGTDFALNLGLNYTMESGLAVGARYSIGLGDINDFPGESSKIHNSVLAFYLAFFFL